MLTLTRIAKKANTYGFRLSLRQSLVPGSAYWHARLDGLDKHGVTFDAEHLDPEMAIQAALRMMLDTLASKEE
ncbi:MAG: hypothetical protein Q7O66_14910 [Dehalococcoidia bacterium]|nr:hypothetical protein [Dehalococcoidia bacterium]